MTTMSFPTPVLLTPFITADVGSPQLAGSAAPAGNGWDLVAGGADIWETADQFRFVFQEIRGDRKSTRLNSSH